MDKTTKKKIYKEIDMLCGAIAGVCLAHGIDSSSVTFKMLTKPIHKIEKLLKRGEVQA